MSIIEKWREGMSSKRPTLIFGLLQLILGRQESFMGDDLYNANDPGERIEP